MHPGDPLGRSCEIESKAQSMQPKPEQPARSTDKQSNGLSFLSRRARQEGIAAMGAPAIKATTIHVISE
jgi:hypothetical protein